MVEAFDVAEMLDLLECGLEKLRRIKDSVFVFRIGSENNFFEWVIIPKTDSYIPSPSLAGLPPNEKFFFILNQLPTLTNQLVERFRRISSIFRLVCDSFADVPTWHVFHVADNVTMKSNATLCKVAAMLINAKNCRFNRYDSEFFARQADDDISISSGASDDYLEGLTAEEREEVEYLKSAVGENSILSPGEQETSSKFNVTLDGREKSHLSFNEADFADEEEDEPYEYEEEEDLYHDRNEGPLRKPKRKKKKQPKKVVIKELPPEKTSEQLRLEEEERRRQEELEAEERKKTIELLRKARSPKKTETKPAEPKKKPKSVKSAKSIMESSQFSKMSKRDRVSERIAKLRQMREMEEEEEEEEDSSELREFQRIQNMTAEERYKREMQKRLKARQTKFTKISVLVNKAQRASRDKAISIEELEKLQNQIDQALEEAKKFRAEAKDEIEFLRDTLAYRKQKHAQNQVDIKEIRNVYLERHCENVMEIDKRKRKEAKMKAEFTKQEQEEKAGGRKPGKQEKTISTTNRSPEYEMAVKYLEEEIEKVKADISILKKRAPNRATA
ncbi:hypothetical protein TRFO_25267 [Tritrichomonas foetus]|uniref:Uncharacterized protein n=1 Tax=Tritrichomonas foetus TaxID=1144522 RepID=A0A1J4KAD1_9EUKA|nr:hypothetical protein TRFO_25267 [Tritrichomonas foetus]|eukprot:OHT06652.1 hypothetical protein TRFO_25267 [Tritrichomonas foetus]